MLLSLALLIFFGLLLSTICKLLKLPGLIGLILAGILLGPSLLNLIDLKLLNISPELRKMALIVILIRAGLNLNTKDLAKIGKPAILLSFIPATFEIISITILGPILLGISYIDALLIGSIIAAVSPAVIIPSMLKIKSEDYGKKKSIPDLILAASSIDDIYVIILFTMFLNLNVTNNFNINELLKLPSSLILGIFSGIIIGIIFVKVFNKFHIRDSYKVIILIAISFTLVTIEDILMHSIGFSGLIAIMILAISINNRKQVLANRLSVKFSKLWLIGEVILFTLVGTSVNIQYALDASANIIILIILCTTFRFFSVFICLIKTNLNKKEKVFVAMSYIPKATVQAAIGGIPLSMHLPIGNQALIIAIASILITAPLGAIMIDHSYKKLLSNK